MSLKTSEIITGEFYCHSFTGRLYRLELIHAIHELWGGQYQFSDSVNELWDLTQTKFSHMSFQLAEELSKEVLDTKIAFKPGKVAILTKDNADKYLISYLLGLMENQTVRTIRLFQNCQEAYDFLGYELPENQDL
ncbi:MAG: hypothetical protein GY781_13025 [Gammaproteobacteria bacterium]|nr:hypothetical protein [Gammaproteobacteria bacterium]